MTKARGAEFVLDQPLEFEIRCQTTPAASEWTTHPVTIHPDWSFTTPHDLAAEAVAAAFGGWLSCLQLGDAISAVRYGISLAQRSVPYPLFHIARDVIGWGLAGGFANCWCFYYPEPISAAERARSSEYFVAKFGALEWQADAIIARLSDSFDRCAGPPRGVAGLPGEVVEYLWTAGLHPARVEQLIAAVGVEGRTLCADFYVAAAGPGVSWKWLRRALATCPDDRAIVLASARNNRTRRSLEAWLAIGTVPSHTQFQKLRYLRPIADRHSSDGFYSAAPASAALDDLESQLRADDFHFDRSDLAFLLVIAGTADNVVRELRGESPVAHTIRDCTLVEALHRVRQAGR